MENSWKTASTIGTLLSTQVPVPMISWMRLQSKPIATLVLILKTGSPGRRNGRRAKHLLPLCRCVQNPKEPTPPEVHVVQQYVKLLSYFFAIIAQIFCQPAIRLNRSHCPPDAVLLPASEQFYMTFNFQW